MNENERRHAQHHRQPRDIPVKMMMIILKIKNNDYNSKKKKKKKKKMASRTTASHEIFLYRSQDSLTARTSTLGSELFGSKPRITHNF